MEKTKIDWCDSTWNPVTGCFHECKYCYARGIANRFGGTDSVVFDEEYRVNVLHELDEPLMLNGKKAAYPFGFAPTLHRYRLDDYVGKVGRTIFVCSMADLFGAWVPDEWIEEVFVACKKAPQHKYIFLTKNPERYMQLADKGILPTEDNFWFGSTATGPSEPFWWSRVHNTCVSIEPMLEPYDSVGDVAVKKTDWIIIGAETGRRKDKVIPKREWIEAVVNDCRATGTPLFMKSSLEEIWGEPLIQEFPEKLRRTYSEQEV